MIKQGLVPEDLQQGYKSNITRAEFTKIAGLVLSAIVGKAADEKLPIVLTEQRFTDTFEEHVYKAYNFGIVNGVSDSLFEPDRPIVRKEAVVMMANILTTLKVNGLATDKAPYTDYAAIPSWAKSSANLTYHAKIFTGSNAGMEPDKPYTREQSIVTMRRLLNYAKDIKGISYRGKVHIAFEKIDDVRVGKNYVKLGSPKREADFLSMWNSIASNFPNIDLPVEGSQSVTSGEYRIQTRGEDYLIQVSW
ncbi:S-layer homology domain-containing protein [Cohnella sp. GCM10027633]|uniref:S-layer homology domain-containing protein n=1 Tax=unclassified Cohnella TaxID=2636738 RepID=UPI00362A025A